MLAGCYTGAGGPSGQAWAPPHGTGSGTASDVGGAGDATDDGDGSDGQGPHTPGSSSNPGVDTGAADGADGSTGANDQGEVTIDLVGRLDPRPPLNYYDNETGEGDIYNGIWGYAAGGREYALLTGGQGLSVVDVTDATAPQEVQFVAMTGGDVHRDVVVVGTHAYVAAQEGGRLEIVDLAGLPAAAPVVGTFATYTNDGHTVAVHGDMLFLNTATDGCRILDVSSPTAPTPVATYFQGNECHDSAVHGDMLFVAGGYTEFYDVVDLSDPSSPQRLGRTDAVDGIYAHSVAVSEDGQTLYAFEEFNSVDVLIYDVSDPASPTLQSTWAWPSEAIVHNGTARGDYLFLAYYESGFVIVDVSEPTAPKELTQFITYPPPQESIGFAHPEGGFFNGAWNVYLDLPSGRILVSDMLSGLYIFDVTLP